MIATKVGEAVEMGMEARQASDGGMAVAMAMAMAMAMAVGRFRTSLVDLLRNTGHRPDYQPSTRLLQDLR